MANIIKFGKKVPHIRITVSGGSWDGERVFNIPRSALEDIASLKKPLWSIKDWDTVIPAIILSWLDMLPK